MKGHISHARFLSSIQLVFFLLALWRCMCLISLSTCLFLVGGGAGDRVGSIVLFH